MQIFPPTLVWRHRRENLKKCSLRGLEQRKDFIFYSYPNQELPHFKDYILLELDAPPLTPQDMNHGLLIIDSTWRYSEKMVKKAKVNSALQSRSIPPYYYTAYPRRQDDCSDASRGLASIEAIYIAYKILHRDTSGLLDHYFWKEQFLEIVNKEARA